MDMAFDETVFAIGSKLVTKLYNAGKFVLMQDADRGEITTELDRAFVHDLRDTVQRATNAFENFEFAHALQITETFFWDAFADNYIELVKRRARSATRTNRAEHQPSPPYASASTPSSAYSLPSSPQSPTKSGPGPSPKRPVTSRYTKPRGQQSTTSPPSLQRKGARDGARNVVERGMTVSATNSRSVHSTSERHLLPNRLPSHSRRPKSQTRSEDWAWEAAGEVGDVGC